MTEDLYNDSTEYEHMDTQKLNIDSAQLTEIRITPSAYGWDDYEIEETDEDIIIRRVEDDD